MGGEIGLGLAVLGLGLGLRHGIDWDHIAAITDVTSAQPSRARGLVMGTLYALGHASVVVMLGLVAIWAAAQLPAWVDTYLEKVVGTTLVLLGVWVFYSLARSPQHFRLRSRWMLLFDAAKGAARWLKSRLTGQTYLPVAAGAGYYGVTASTGIGMIHGIGAETGSQALLLAAAAGATSVSAGTFLLLFFTFGLILSNSAITLASTLGVIGAQRRRLVYTTIGVVIGSFSLAVGVLFLLGKSSALPTFFA